MKKLLSLLLVLSLALSILPVGSVFAEEDKTEGKSKTELRIESVKKHYKDLDVQNRLIDKVKKGELFDSMNPEKKSKGVVEKIDEHITLTTFPDGSKIKEGIDYSEATFYDNGKEISNPYKPKEDKKTDEFSLITIFNSIKSFVEPPKAQAAVISGGTWSSGSGYRCAKGVKVFKQVYSNYQATFYADFCNHYGGYDKLSRVYGVDVESDGEFSYVSQGVFRASETYSYNAYGGVKFTVKSNPDLPMTTENLYLRVGNDTYWYQASF